jgi:hypothetical protein
MHLQSLRAEALCFAVNENHRHTLKKTYLKAVLLNFRRRTKSMSTQEFARDNAGIVREQLSSRFQQHVIPYVKGYLVCVVTR